MQLLPVKCFGFFEFIGTTELLVVLFVALLVFGPRKLPELGRSLGRALTQVRDASDDFKRTWEAEALAVNVEPVSGSLPPAAAQPADEATSGPRREA
jgi:TatA/E family protein of Tat protein translocase